MAGSSFVDADGVDLLALLRALIAIASPDPPGDELKVAELVHATLHELGIPAELDVFAPGRANVIGRLQGRGTAPALVLSAHMDTVPVGTRPWTRDPFGGAVEGSRVFGRGAADVKGELAAMIAAAADLRARDVPLPGDVVLAFTAGESSNLLGARRCVQRGLMDGVGALLVGEPSGLDVVAVEMAALWLRLTATGRIGHVSGDPGCNAIDVLRHALNRLEGVDLPGPAHPLTGPARLAVGRIEGGSAVNVTPDRCHADIDLRLPPGVDPAAAEAVVAAAVRPAVEVTRLDLKPAVEAATDAAFTRRCQAAVRRHGGRGEVRGVAYFSDAAVLAAGRDVAFAIVGPGEIGLSAQPDEWVDLAKVEAAARIYAEVAESWG